MCFRGICGAHQKLPENVIFTDSFFGCHKYFVLSLNFINSVMCCLRLGTHVAYWDCYLCILLSFVISILKCSLHYNVILNQHAWSTWCIYHSFHTLLSSSNVHFFRFHPQHFFNIKWIKILLKAEIESVWETPILKNRYRKKKAGS